jgi:hypothetical protein
MVRRDRRPIAYTALAGVTLVALVVAALYVTRSAVPPPVATPTAAVATATPSPASATPSGTPSAAPTPAASPAASASPGTGVLDDRFGFLVMAGPSRSIVRPESDPGITIGFTTVDPAISVDGRSIARWESTGSTAGPQTLAVGLISGGRDPQRPVTLQPGERGGHIAWSSDGTGLLVAVNTGSIPDVGAPTANTTELRAVDLATGTQERFGLRSNTGRVWYPVAWDRAAKVAAAGTTGPGGFVDEYVVFSLAQTPATQAASVKFVNVRMVISGLRASTDARFAMTTDLDSGAVHWWPLADPAKKAIIERGPFIDALWKPGTSQIAWVGGPVPAGCTLSCGGTDLILHDVVTGARTTAHKVSSGTHLAFFRVDGSAAILAAQSASDLTVMDMATGRTATVSDRGPIVSAVRLR